MKQYGNGSKSGGNAHVMPATESDKSPQKVAKAVSGVKSSQHSGQGTGNPGHGERTRS